MSRTHRVLILPSLIMGMVKRLWSKEAGSSKLIQEEEKESGRVSWRVYKLYVTEAWGWWFCDIKPKSISFLCFMLVL
jgi:hypothetical protein